MLRSLVDAFSRHGILRIGGLLSLLWLLTSGLVPNLAQAQTPTTTVQNGNADTRLQLNYDGGLVVPGIYGPTTPADSIPASGAGTRLMWYPAKAAFRAGLVTGSQWDASNVGSYSVALNNDTRASGIYSTAMSFETVADGFASVALNDNTRAEATNSVAMGESTVASGDEAVAMGRGTEAGTDHSLTLGQCNDANTSFGGPLFAVGNGSFDSNTETCSGRSDALVLDQSGNLTISGGLTENSDRRLKTAVKPLGDGVLGRLSEIRPVRYQFKDQSTHPSGEQLGLIAQDVRKEFPSLVSKGTGGYFSLAYPKMTAVLLKGIQEQQAQLEKKQTQIDSLKEKVRQIQDIKSRLAALEAERSRSVVAGLTGSSAGLLAIFLLGGLVGAGLLWRRRG